MTNIPPKGSFFNSIKNDPDLKNMTQAEVARKYGKSQERVRQVLKELNLKCITIGERNSILQKEKYEKKLSDKMNHINLISNHWKSGMPVKDMAIVFGLTEGSMHVRINELRSVYPDLFPNRLKQVYHVDISEELIADYLSNMSYKDISVKYNVSEEYISNRILRLRKLYPDKFLLRKKLLDINLEEFKKDYSSMTYEELADKHKISIKSVYRLSLRLRKKSPDLFPSKKIYLVIEV